MAPKKIEVNISTKKSVNEVIALKKAYEQQNVSSSNASKITREYTNALRSLTNQTSGLQLKLNNVTRTIGLSLGFKELIGSAHDANMEIWRMHNSVKDMTDQFGDTGKVMSAVWKAYGTSAVSFKETEQILRGFNQTGLEVNTTISEMAGWVGRVGQASGVSSEAITGMMGKSIKFWKVSQKGAKDMVHAVFASKAAFGLTSGQVQELMGIVNNTQDKIAYAFQDGEKSSIALAKGITMAAGAMTKLGINAQTATSFVEGLLNPEEISKNTALLRRMGITYQDQVDMMNSAGGKEVFFDKLMMQLPRISNELASIRDPFVRMNVSKNLGLPMEIAAKMAGKTSGEIQEMLVKYKDMKKAADTQQTKMKAQQERWDESKQWLKWNALLPLMEWAQKMYKYMWPFLNAVSTGMQKANTYFVKFLDSSFDAFKPIYDIIVGTNKSDVIKTIGDVALNTFKQVSGFVAENIPTIISAAMPILAETIATTARTFVQAIPVIVENVGKLIQNGFEKGLGTGSVIMGFLGYKLWSYVKDAALQYIIIRRYWGKTNDYLAKIAGENPVSGLLDFFRGKGKGTHPNSPVPAGKAPKIDGLSKKNVITMADNFGDAFSAAAKSSKLLKVTNIFSKFTGIFTKFGGALFGASKAIPVLGTILTIIGAIAGVAGIIKNFVGDDNYKDMYKMTQKESNELNIAMTKTTEQRSVAEQELIKRQQQSARYQELMEIKKTRALKGFEEMQLNMLENQRKKFDLTRAAIGAFGDGLSFIANIIPGVNTNLGNTLRNLYDGVQSVSDPTKVAKNTASGIKQGITASGDHKLKNQYNEKIKRTFELEKQYERDKSEATREAVMKNKEDLLKMAKDFSATSGNTILGINEVSSNMFWEQTKNAEIFGGTLGGALDRAQVAAKEIERSMSSVDLEKVKEKDKEYLDSLTDAQENWADDVKAAKERMKKYEDFKGGKINMDIENSRKSQYSRDAALVAQNQVNGAGLDTNNVLRMAQRNASNFDKYLETLGKQNKTTQSKFDSLDRSLVHISDTGDSEIEQRSIADNNNLYALASVRKTTDFGNKTAEEQLKIQLAALDDQISKAKDDNAKMEWYKKWFTNANEQNDAIITSAESMKTRLNNDAETRKAHEKEVARSLGGIKHFTAKTAKNTEKDPAVKTDYVGNLLKYIGGNADLRTVGF